MLMELAIGDAYGACFEFASDSFVRNRNMLIGYTQHPWHTMKPGSYTDDTQMSLAVAELILSEKPWEPEVIAGFFLQAFHRDPRKGYSKSMQSVLAAAKSPSDLLFLLDGNSICSGAAMRSAPIGVFPNPEEVASRAKIQAAVTHDTPDGKASAAAAALMAHYCLYAKGPKSALPEFLNDYLSGEWRCKWSGKVGSLGMECVQAALTALMQTYSMTDLLKQCVSFTGDVDTVAAIALASGSCCSEMEQDLPGHLYEHLENERYGLNYIQQLDGLLMARALLKEDRCDKPGQ